MSIKTLKADLQLARIKHRTNPCETTLGALEKAQNAYDLAVSGQPVLDERSEDLGTESATSGSTENEHTTPDGRQEPIDSLTGFTPTELAEFKQAVDAFLRGPSNVKRVGIIGSSVGRSMFAATCLSSSCSATNAAAGDVDRLPVDTETAHSEHEAGAGSVDEKTTTEAPNSEPVTTQLAEPEAAPSPAVAEPAKPAKVSTGTSKGKANSEQKKTKETAK
ncbi:hypothetical protein [Siphonobacter curvatus]|uniref:Uncharacterized protein n=1 Tax=Siphonobacter curvatus TaxID=2094562 RepID=A0A2S7INA3_9BACT|nr:hypothetical protein [Siphonobacter curvatus]PQA59175.1 hypothetical protein C5O19_05830 [Siphonobacter curvatus]